MSWLRANAIATLRTVLGDAAGDHVEFKAEVSPTPDGLHDTFFCGRTRIVDDDSFAVFVNGEQLDTSDFELAPTPGTVQIECAPSGVVLVSFEWRWFDDDELLVFLDDAANSLSYENGVEDSTLPVPLRSIVLELASTWAFTRKAAEYAEALEASSPDGYSINTGKSHPNWEKLAAAAYDRAQKKWKFYLENPLLFDKPAMAFTTFRLPRYQP